MNFWKLSFLLLFILPLKEIRACVGMDYLLDINQVDCHGGNDGSIRVVPTLQAGDLPYTYSLNGGTFRTNALFSGLIAGNYTLVVRNSLGCDYTHPDPITITEPDALQIQLNIIPAVCGNDAKVYPTITGGVSPYIYTWNDDPASKMDTLKGLSSGTVKLEVLDQNNCTETESITLSPTPPFSVAITASETSIKLGEEVELTSTVTGGSQNFSYQWYPDNNIECANCSETSTYLYNSTTVRLQVHDLEYGCVASDSVFIEVEGEFYLYIPNAFSPNGDRKNDLFLVYGTGILGATLNVYDKNGFLIFNGEALVQGWDGTVSGSLSPAGLYFYHADIRYIDGTIQQQKGQITLIR